VTHARARTTQAHSLLLLLLLLLLPSQDLKDSLAELGSMSPDFIVAVELLWTPQERGDAYSKDELLIDYPGLMNL
jgi:uncharacterized membrane protein